MKSEYKNIRKDKALQYQIKQGEIYNSKNGIF